MLARFARPFCPATEVLTEFCDAYWDSYFANLDERVEDTDIRVFRNAGICQRVVQLLAERGSNDTPRFAP